MEKTEVRKFARVLRVIVIVIFVCNIIVLFLVPALTYLLGAMKMLFQEQGESIGVLEALERLSSDKLGSVLLVWLPFYAWREIWQDSYLAVLAMFLEVCGVCTAVILWQGKRVLDTIIKGEPFTLGNAANLKRAAVCCFVISAAALVRLIWGFFYYKSISPLLTYNALFVPVFLVGGLLCMVMSALFRQAAELKAENDLTI